MVGAMRVQLKTIGRISSMLKTSLLKAESSNPSLSTCYRNIHTTIRPMTSQSVDVGGVKIHYDRVGSGNQVLLLLPGALGSSRMDFSYQIENLNKDLFTVIAWDPRGYGLSRPPDRDWPNDFLRRDADDAARLMQVLQKRDTNLGQGKYSLLGWSDGGTTALLMALKYPDRVDKMVVWGAASYITEDDVRANESVRNIDDWSPRIRAPFEELYGREYLKKLANDWTDAYNSYMDLNNGDICNKELKNIKCPTLIVHGQKDPLVGQFHADNLYANIPNSKLINMPDGKHNLHKKYHKVFNSLVEQFIVNPKHVSSNI